MRVDGRDGRDVHLGGEDELVVDDVVGRVARIQGAGGMQLDCEVRPQVDVLARTLVLGRLVIVSRADALANNVPVHAAAVELHLLHLHDIQKLLPNLLGSAEGLGVEEMLDAPSIRVSVCFPGRVHLKVRQVVRLVHPKLFSLSIGLILSFLWSVEDVRNRQHRHDGNHLLAAPILLRRNQKLGQRRIHGEGAHLASQLCQLAKVVQCAESPQVKHGR
ncbi:Uncharacterized protein TPAR_07791 [Tolypocladium paradoxum]|uniref:Uncharacterized protein n=1 Tax=Tolypocladium paradoxum TaxID=94208 RepID=A0A2S4KP63_9HYPO|nr:Uncharacterized protein TPAR_07791 [Tolypocladium paradoxum]